MKHKTEPRLASRDGQPHDAHAITRIASQHWGKETAHEVLQSLREKFTACIIGEIRDQYVYRASGFIVYEVERKYLSIRCIAVDENLLRCGIGSKMVDRLKSFLLPKYQRRIRCSVADDLLQTHLFLKYNGFSAKVESDNSYLFEFGSKLAF